MSARKMIPFLLLNVLVSSVVVLAILYWWDNRDGGSETAVSIPTTITPAIPVQNTVVFPPIAPTNTPEPDDGPLIHIVQPGDTLGTISQLYDVSLDEIMAENGLSNPNIISVGQQLVIPIGGVSTPVPEDTAVPEEAVLPSPIPTEPVGAGEAVVEITAVIGPDRLADEAILLTNSGEAPIALQNWTLLDEDGHEYEFGQVTLFAGSDLRINTTSGANSPTALYWGLNEAIWTSGETVTLQDSTGTTRVTYEVP
ncbi:LysM peptidoglycan-binding domain-containing protein [Candidatus Leptofilum sp.]|uniref:LysM peptidoglycan-binding domain-containing protein n=1 Tax=Candidatus Leptofilum sp. TaxID=3241576 RepID=UPI003B5AA18C